MESQQGSDQHEGGAGPRKTPVLSRPATIALGSVLLLGLFYGALTYLAETLTHESTDDAFLDADIVSLAPKVAGQVTNVFVTHNQPVTNGQILLQIDSRDLEMQVSQKKAALESARANSELTRATLGLFARQIDTAEATARQSAAEAAASRASAEKAGADLKRAEELFREKTISPQEFDSAKAAAAIAEANLKSAQQKEESDRSKIAELQSQLDAGKKGYDRSQAQERQAAWDERTAELNLSYTTIAAPEAGYITRKAVQAGDYVQVGQRLLAIVPSNYFVSANFKETQLRKIRPGQKVRVEIDSVAREPFLGHVDSIQAGSGSRFSLLPPENAVGNYVKVVQRVPVKILFDEPLRSAHVLGPGMSVVPTVRVSNRDLPLAAAVLISLVVASGAGVLWWTATRKSREREG